jgi:hypothetical protein
MPYSSIKIFVPGGEQAIMTTAQAPAGSLALDKKPGF